MLKRVWGLGWDLDVSTAGGRACCSAPGNTRQKGSLRKWIEGNSCVCLFAILFFPAFSDKYTHTWTYIYTYAWSKRSGTIMQSPDRGWYLVCDKLLPQTKLLLSSLLKSLLVSFGLTLWGMVSNLGKKRRQERGRELVHKMSSMHCPEHITECLQILPNTDWM